MDRQDLLGGLNHDNTIGVSDFGLVHLKGLTNLRKLNLGGTKVTDAGVQDLQKVLPKVTIIHWPKSWVCGEAGGPTNHHRQAGMPGLRQRRLRKILVATAFLESADAAPKCLALDHWPLWSLREKRMMNQSKAIAFDVDPASLLSLREALPEWEIEAVRGATAALLTQDSDPGAADLLIVGARDDVTETLGLCRGLRSQAGRAVTPLLVLVPPAQPALVRAALEAGADSCLVLPVNAKEVASMLAHARAGNQPGRHTLNLDQAQREDRWRDDGGQG
jgi:CheY-like chemotaxis protein